MKNNKGALLYDEKQNARKKAIELSENSKNLEHLKTKKIKYLLK